MPTFHRKGELRFEFHLAERLGKTVAELRRDLPVKEYEQWKILSQIEASEAEARKNRNKGKH